MIKYTGQFLVSLSILLIFSGCFGFKKAESIEYSQKYDAIVVPGYPFEPDKKNQLILTRVYWAKKLLEKGVANNIIFTGGAVHTPYVESEVMKQIAINLGIDSNRIFVETKAEHTIENLAYAYDLAKKYGFNKIAIATDPIQTKSFEGFVWRFNFKDVGFIPINYNFIDNDEISQMPLPDIQPISEFIPLKKRQNRFQRHWISMGMKINTKNNEKYSD